MNTQIKFNQVESRIQEVKLNIQFERGHLAKLFATTELNNLEIKLSELAMELMAERYASAY
jgi:hypothetical protein